MRSHGQRARRVLTLALGSFLVIGGATLATMALTFKPAPLPYVYESDNGDKTSEAVTELAALAGDAKVETLKLQTTERGQVLATLQTLQAADSAPMIIGWHSEIAEPLIRSDIDPKEELKLITALRQHLPGDATVFALPALSNRLELFVEAEFPMAAVDDSDTLRLPGPWRDARDAVSAAEKQWIPVEVTESKPSFDSFADALLAEDLYGAAKLQVLANGRESYLVLHVRDAFDLGIALSDRIGVGLRDFPAAGQVHDKMKMVKTWVAEEGHAAYAVLPRNDDIIRAYFLADAKSKSTLVGQLLPFDTARLGQVPGVTLVFQHGGYWIYRIDAVRAANTTQG